MAVKTEEYETLALREPDQRWELVCGVPRKKPVMTQEHQTTAWWLAHMIGNQVDPRQFQVRDNGSRAGSGTTYFIPDVIVIPRAMMKSHGPDGPLETYSQPVPFVAEVWSRSTGDYDVDTKFPEYRRRGDLEIWRLDPYAREVTAWRRKADGTYSETRYTGGVVAIESLPGVSVSLEELFAMLD